MAEKILSKQNYLPLVLSIVAVLLMAVLMRWQGRLWWCKLGDYAIYINEAWKSSHTSQHFLDPYTFTHILHGVMFFWLAALIFPKLSAAWRLFIGMFVEAAWEVLENTNYVIDKYRENTASLDYFGDSVFNSVGDALACALGLWATFKLGWWKSFAVFLLIEIVLLLWIRDGLLLNILMLIYPLDSIKQWQMS